MTEQTLKGRKSIYGFVWNLFTICIVHCVSEQALICIEWFLIDWQELNFIPSISGISFSPTYLRKKLFWILSFSGRDWILFIFFRHPQCLTWAVRFKSNTSYKSLLFTGLDKWFIYSMAGCSDTSRVPVSFHKIFYISLISVYCRYFRYWRYIYNVRLFSAWPVFMLGILC